MTEADLATINELLPGATLAGAYGLGAIIELCRKAGRGLPPRDVLLAIASAETIGSAMEAVGVAAEFGGLS